MIYIIECAKVKLWVKVTFLYKQYGKYSCLPVCTQSKHFECTKKLVKPSTDIKTVSHGQEWLKRIRHQASGIRHHQLEKGYQTMVHVNSRTVEKYD